MNNIGFGIFCFGEEFYYKGTIEKIKNILNSGYHCYILTEDPGYIEQQISSMYLHFIKYDRSFKSYSDKLILLKYILKQHQIGIILDADANIVDYSFLNELKNYEFKYGISYIETLLAHSARKEFVKDLINIQHQEWSSYDLYSKKIYPTYRELQTIWEYVLVINKTGFNEKRFFDHYEKLQLAKEFSDLGMGKEVNGAGEGISIAIASKLSETDLNYDLELKQLLKDKIKPITKRTPHNELPSWMK
jgi:hypothetical protein